MPSARKTGRFFELLAGQDTRAVAAFGRLDTRFDNESAIMITYGRLFGGIHDRLQLLRSKH